MSRRRHGRIFDDHRKLEVRKKILVENFAKKQEAQAMALVGRCVYIAHAFHRGRRFAGVLHVDGVHLSMSLAADLKSELFVILGHLTNDRGITYPDLCVRLSITEDTYIMPMTSP